LKAVDFMIAYGSIVSAMADLLDRRFTRNEDFNTPIGKALKSVLLYHNAQKYQERDYELARLAMLVKHLDEIRKHNQNMLGLFRVRINRDDANYYGFRFEAAVASSLIRRGIRFEKMEQPDFKVSFNGGEVFLECASIHLSNSRPNELRRKIESVISEKRQKGYEMPNVALFVDVTNIYYHIVARQGSVRKEEVKEHTQQAIERTRFGDITLFVYVLNKELERFELNYLRHDNHGIDRVLKRFLDQHYTYEIHEVHDFALPERG